MVYRELAKVHPYVTASRKAGVDLKILAASGPVTIDGFAGLLLMGGSDVDPKLYGEAPRGETDPPDEQRDKIEMALIQEALKRDLPILAICRGLQLLNVCHGGSLIQHLHSSERHQQTKGNHSLPVHEVRITPNTLLGAIAGRERWSVNSRHHQAVQTVDEPAGFRHRSGGRDCGGAGTARPILRCRSPVASGGSSITGSGADQNLSKLWCQTLGA